MSQWIYELTILLSPVFNCFFIGSETPLKNIGQSKMNIELVKRKGEKGPNGPFC